MNRMNGSGENGFMRTARVPYKVLYALLFTLLVVIVVLLLPSERRAGQDGWEGGGGHGVFLIKEDYALYSYNDTYPLTPPNCESVCVYISACYMIYMTCVCVCVCVCVFRHRP